MICVLSSKLIKQALQTSCELLRQRNMEPYGTECNLMDGSASVTACKFMAILRTLVSLGNLGYPWATLGIHG